MVLVIPSCKKPEQHKVTHATAELGGVMIVDEIYGLSQDLNTEKMDVTIRGWLTADDDGKGYKLYNAAWDPFDTKTKEGITSISLKFEEPPSDYWIGQYANVSGRLVTEPSANGDRNVTLENANVVSVRSDSGHEIPCRATTRLSREAESSGLELELRRLHARQKFGPLTLSGTNLGELYQTWHIKVFDMGPMVDQTMRMVPQGIIWGDFANRDEPVTIDMTGKTPLESLNLICETFDAYFIYTENFAIRIAASKDDLKPRPSSAGNLTEEDPFASDE